ncbi:hypothetical protein V8G54_037812 [Vigna mungo]|uniref:Mannose-P-dolichol utilization defect 1 protein homolog n=1 Tax=Vigna mungo TaxID=3915 RepID=A0AAQ3REI7_VIGMU
MPRVGNVLSDYVDWRKEDVVVPVKDQGSCELVGERSVFFRSRSWRTMEYLGIDLSCAVGSLRHGHFPEKDCLLPLISKLLGYAIVAASTTVKLPQALIIMKILKHKSVRGLSMISFELEVIGYTIALAYCLHKGLSFSAYGELLFLLIQAIILVSVIYYYSRPLSTITCIRALLYSAIAPTIFAGQIDPLLFEALYASQHAIFLFARIPQIWQNFSNKSTGELSFLTSFMNFAGSMVRVFTTIQENAPNSGKLMLNLFCSLGLCNWCRNKFYHPKSDNIIPKTPGPKGEENQVIEPYRVVYIFNVLIKRLISSLYC